MAVKVVPSCLETAGVVTGNEADFAPAGIVTVIVPPLVNAWPLTVIPARYGLSEMITGKPPVGAGALIDTVRVVFVPPTTSFGLMVNVPTRPAKTISVPWTPLPL